jgi:crotonobetainyl-CoA:carnitine CoA-transferase CaiB-like acyl-CoA transferase
LIARFSGAGVPCTPINTYSQVLADPQVAAMGWVQDIDLPNGARTRTFVSPVRLTGKGLPVYRNPPALGADGAEVLDELQASGGTLKQRRKG